MQKQSDLHLVSISVTAGNIGVERGGGGGGGGGPNNPPTFSFNFYVKQEKNHKCTKLQVKIIINVILI